MGLEYGKLPFLKNVVYIPHDKSSKVPDGFSCWEDVLELGKSVTDEELDAVSASLEPHEVINMQYTSGTTGFPKASC